jgi:hypothetical protein
MLGKALGLMKKQKKTADQSTGAGGKSRAQLGDISKMLNASGRIGLQMLQKMAKVYNKIEFERFMQQPVLVGSSIQAGSLATQNRHAKEELNKTVIFEVDTEETASSSSDSLKHAIYPLIKNEYSSGPVNIFSIGRIDGNDMIMPDYAISKQHATIEIKRNNYLIRDGVSTNGTKINGKRVDKKPVQIRDKDVIAFARYEFTFFSPESLYNMLRGE